MNNETVKKLVKGFRDKARAILRLEAVNGLVERLQEVTGSLSKAKAKIEANLKKLTDIASGAYAVDVSNAINSKDTPDEIKARMTKSLEDQNVSLNKQVEDLTKQAADLEAEITLAATGGKGYAFSKSEITRVANELIREEHGTFDLSDVSGTEDEVEEDERP